MIVLNRIMKQVRDKNQSAFLQSYDQFYAEAYKAIFNEFPGMHGLSETILDSLTESQINQYNFIELQTFELNKEIKSKLSRFNQSQVSAMMIRIRNVVQELQRMCSSLKIKFIFELFQKISTCLIMMTSLHFAKNQKQQQKNQNIADVNECQQKQIGKKSCHGNDGKITCVNKEEQQNLFLGSKKGLKLQKTKLGGVSLYNENYKRNIENKDYISELNQSIGERTKFWKQLQNNCKETLGTTLEAIENRKQKTYNKNRRGNIDLQNKIGQKQNETQVYGLAFLNLSNDKNVEFRTQVKVKDSQTFSQNAENILHNYEQLCLELNSFDFSDQGVQKIIEDVSGLYKKQKIITLDSLKKVVTKFWYLHQQRSQKMIEMIKRQVQINKIMESKLMKKKQNMKQVEVQTIPCIAMQKKKQECERLKGELNILEKVKKGLEQVITKQHMSIALLSKANGENMKKLESKQKVCRQYEQKLCNQINKKQNKAGNKTEIQSKCWSFYQIDSCRKNVIEKDSIQFTQHQLQMHDDNTQQQIITNTNISGGFSSQGITSKFNKNSGRHIHFDIDQSSKESHRDHSLTKFNNEKDPILQSLTIDICQYRNDLARNSSRKKIMKDHGNNSKKQLFKESQRFSQKRSEKGLALSKMDLNKAFLRDYLNSQQNKMKLCSIVCSINLEPSLPIEKYRSLKYSQNVRKCSLASQKSLLSKKKKQLTWRHTSRNNIQMSKKTLRYEKSQQKEKEETTAQHSLKQSKILNSKKQKALITKQNERLIENKYYIDRSTFQKMRLSSHQSQKYISYVSQLKQKYQGKQLITNQLCQRRFSDENEHEQEHENQGFFNVVQTQLPKNQLPTDEKADEIKLSYQSQPFVMKQNCNISIINKVKSANSQNSVKESLKEQKIKKICNSKLNKVVHYTKPYFLQLQQTIREQSDIQDEETRKIEASKKDQGQWYKQHRKQLRVTVPNNRLYDLSIGKIREARKQYRKPCNRRIMNAKKVMLSFDNSQTED